MKLPVSEKNLNIMLWALQRSLVADARTMFIGAMSTYKAYFTSAKVTFNA